MTTPYIDIAAAQLYFDDRLNSEAWTAASVVDQLKALKMATQLINNLKFIGQPAVSGQSNEFPRLGQSTVPIMVQQATCEIAIQLLDDIDPNLEADGLAIQTIQYGDLKIMSNQAGIPVYTRNNIPSSRAWALLVPYLIDPTILKLVRVN